MDSSLLNKTCVPRNWIHNVFPSFHGEDVRITYLSHTLKEFKSKGIVPFIDDEMNRGEFIGPELKKAIQESRIAIIFLSKGYASSSWCLDELVEMLKCKKDLGQTVMVIFYEVDPTDVKKQAGGFGKVFKKTCKCKTNEVIRRWSQALAEVATIAGYHSSKWNDDAKMVEDIATDVSNMLFNSTLSKDFNDFVGMGAHLSKIKRISKPDLNVVRMVGIWGPPGIGKTTIARCLLNQLSESNKFPYRVFMTNVKAVYTIPVCSEHYDAKLNLQQNFLSQITNQKEGFKITHLGAARERLHDKRVLVVFDSVDRSAQLDALAKDSRWFGPGSWIIVTTQDKQLLKAHGIEDIYKVDFPAANEALQIFCMNAFGHKLPKDGFYELAEEVTGLAGKNPLGLRVMGSYLRKISKNEWTKALPRLRNNLHGDIEGTLKFSYEALGKEEKQLFIHIACFFNRESIATVEHVLAKAFLNVRQGLHVLAEKSLISTNSGCVVMDNLLAQLGKEIVRNGSASEQSILEPGQRRFLVDSRDIRKVLADDTADTSCVIGIDLKLSKTEETLHIGERAFERMTSLQFLRIDCGYSGLYFRQRLSSISRNIRLLEWIYFPMARLPLNFNPEVLVKLCMQSSKLQKLWDGIQVLGNLKWMDLSYSEKLKELPNLSTTTNLQELNLSGCSSLVNLPFSIGNATNLQKLNIRGCSSLMVLPFSIGNATNLHYLNLSGCTSLVNLSSSIRNATKLQVLAHNYCSKLMVLLRINNSPSLVELPTSIGNATNVFYLNLHHLDLSGCTSLVELPSSIGNAINLKKLNLSGCHSIVNLPFSIGNATSLMELDLSECSSLVELPWSIGNLHKLWKLNMYRCSNIKVLPININMESLKELSLSFCELLESFPEISTNIESLRIYETSIKEIPSSITLWPRLESLWISGRHQHLIPPGLEIDPVLVGTGPECSIEAYEISIFSQEFRTNRNM